MFDNDLKKSALSFSIIRLIIFVYISAGYNFSFSFLQLPLFLSTGETLIHLVQQSVKMTSGFFLQNSQTGCPSAHCQILKQIKFRVSFFVNWTELLLNNEVKAKQSD